MPSVKGKIAVHQLEYDLPVGYYTSESQMRLRIRVDFEVELSLPASHSFHTLKDTLTYEPIVDLIGERLRTRQRFALLEQIAQEVLDAVREMTENLAPPSMKVHRIRVRVSKFPLLGEFVPGGAWASVELEFPG